MSARARFLAPRLCVVKMDSFGVFDGRGRPAVVAVVEDADSREERVEVKT